MSIKVLPPAVAAAIAAGEVVERPASVVKELMENAIDAGAHSVRVEIERGGLDLIRVTDDGSGIPPHELEQACQRHATSKLTAASDLTSLHTLGFRGEALPSIVAAADVQIASRTDGAAGGATLRWRGGLLEGRSGYGGARGTVVTVRNLFSRQPARLKFLRTAGAEASQIAQGVQPYAIAYPEIRFSLSVDGRNALQTTGSGDLRDAAVRVLGTDTGSHLLDISAEAEPRADGIKVRGLISPPALSRATRAGIVLLVNRRWVQPRRLAFAVEQAYETLLMTGRHPLGVVGIELPPQDVDVNVHPTKAEVRFRDERAVFGAVLAAVRRSLVGYSPVPELERPGWTDAGREALPETDVIAGLQQAAPALSLQPSQAQLWQSLLHPTEHDPAGRPAPADPLPHLPLLRVLGQTASTYVIAEGPAGVYLIDQHAAHERVTYERLRLRRASASAEVQGLLAPVSVELSAPQVAVMDEFRPLLAEYGFAFEAFGDRTVLLRAVPSALSKAEPGAAFSVLLDALLEDRESDRNERLLKTLACHGSVRAGKTMSLDEMRELVRLLEDCESPRTCPHGRPTMIHLSTVTLEREFRRR